MKKIYISLIALTVAALSAASCVREPLADTVTPVPSAGDDLYADENTEDDGILAGWVRIKLQNDNANVLKAGIFTRGDISTGIPQLDEIVEKLGVTEVRRTFSDGGKFAQRRRMYGLHLWYDLKIDDQIPITRAQSEMIKIDCIAAAEPLYTPKALNYEVMPANAVYLPPVIRQPMDGEMPFDDPYLNEQWHYNNDGSLKNSVAGADINLFEGWKISTGDREIIVAVIDYGIDYAHEDLAANMWVNEAELNGEPGVDDDNNGYVDDIYGINLVVDSPNTHYNNNSGKITGGFHGTHVAGTIAAVNNNGIGVSGVAGGSGNDDGVRLMSIQIFEPDGTSNTGASYFMDGFLYAAENGAVLANCSFTLSRNYGESSQALDDAMRYFTECAGIDKDTNQQIGPVRGGLIIASNGNAGTSNVYYPAKSDYAIGVAAIDSAGEKAYYSEYGIGTDIFAPGGSYAETNPYQILSTFPTEMYPNDPYGFLVGTSMAAPHVTGVAALIASVNKGQGFTNDQLKAILLRSVRPLPATANIDFGGKSIGLIDASLISLKEPENVPDDIQNFNVTAQPASVLIEWTCPADGNGLPVQYFNLQWAETANPNDVSVIRINNTDLQGEKISYLFAGKSETEYEFTLTAVDRYGLQSESVSAEVTTLIFENHEPVQVINFSNMTFSRLGEDQVRTFALNSYFRDPDAEYGDYLSFTADNSDNSVLDVQLQDATLTIIPIANGESTVTIRVTDTRNASIQASMKITVAYSAEQPEIIASLGSVSMSGGESKNVDLKQYFKITKDIVLSLQNRNPQVAEAEIDTDNILKITAIAAGTTEIVITAANDSGSTVSDTLTVTVAGSGNTGTTPDTIAVSPNPADNYIDVSVPGFENGTVEVIIYDNAMRQVHRTDSKLDSQATCRVDVSRFIPGVYHVKINTGNNSLSSSFVKK